MNKRGEDKKNKKIITTIVTLAVIILMIVRTIIGNRAILIILLNPCPGQVVACSYEAYFDLQVQLRSGALDEAASTWGSGLGGIAGGILGTSVSFQRLRMFVGILWFQRFKAVDFNAFRIHFSAGYRLPV